MTEPHRMHRREAIKWMLAAAGTMAAIETGSFAAPSGATGYGTDPNLLDVYKPGDLWPLTFDHDQRRTVIALCDVIIPADEKSPSASQVAVPAFIDEWISAPYSRQQRDRKEILEGLKWLEAESHTRFGRGFAGLSESRQRAICDDICHEPDAKFEFKKAARFFARFRDLVTGGFYTTPEGMKDIQYIGNVALTKFDGPSAEVLAYLKLT